MTSAAPLRMPSRRNRTFDETHQQLIEAAVQLISAKGVDSLSIAAVARAVNINRTTVYYHFKDRDALLAAVRQWSSAQLMRGLSSELPQQERMDFITRFVLENPTLIKLWIDDFIATGDIRDCYPRWDELVRGTAEHFAASGEAMDAEVYCIMLLSSAIIGPRVLRNSVDQAAATDTIVERFRHAHQRLLQLTALLK